MKFKPYPRTPNYQDLYYNCLPIFAHRMSIDIIIDVYNSRFPINVFYIYRSHKGSMQRYYAILRTLVFLRIITKKGTKYYMTDKQKEAAQLIINLMLRLSLNSRDKLG